MSAATPRAWGRVPLCLSVVQADPSVFLDSCLVMKGNLTLTLVLSTGFWQSSIDFFCVCVLFFIYLSEFHMAFDLVVLEKDKEKSHSGMSKTTL